MNYKAFYRTYRPKNFNEVVGQDHIVRTLVNLIKLNKISHGYLFCGPRGTGKTSIAKIFANAINCIHSETPEKICDRCLANSNNTLDIIEIDAASNNGVNDIRTIREQIEFAPTNSPYKIYIIDEVHMLSKGAFNALLMTLEEPPKHAIFILATTNPDKIPDTILSRVQRYNFKRISKPILEDQLKFIFKNEGIYADQESIEMIANLANGSLRDALSIADQINAYSNSNIKIENLIDIFGLSTIESQIVLINLLSKKAISESLQFFDQLVNNGIDISRLIISLIDLLKDYLIFSKTRNVNLITSTTVDMLEKIIIKEEYVYQFLDILTRLLNDIKYTDIPQQLVQLAMIRICSLDGTMVDVEKRDITNEIIKTNIQEPIPNIIQQNISSTPISNVYNTRETIKTDELNIVEEENGIKTEYKDITDEYFSNEDYLKIPIEQTDSNVQNIIGNNFDFRNDNKNNNDTTKTLLSDFSTNKIEENFENLMDEFSLEEELNKMKKISSFERQEIEKKINKTLEEKLNQFNRQTTTLNDIESIESKNKNNMFVSDEEINETKSMIFKNSPTDEIINSATELLNLSNEMDGNEHEVNESLLSNYDTSKQVIDTNEISINDNVKHDIEKHDNLDNKEFSFSNNEIIDEMKKNTKEFKIENTGTLDINNNSQTGNTSLVQKLTQPNIINLFLLSKKETFDIFKEKLNNSTLSTNEIYDTYVVLLKEVRFICSSNDFILVSSSEDWVIEDIISKSQEKTFKSFIADYFGNNIHFYAITKKDYIVSKELYGELKKSGRIPEVKPLSQINNISDENQRRETSLNEIESKSKSLFGNLFSRKKE